MNTLFVLGAKPLNRAFLRVMPIPLIAFNSFFNPVLAELVSEYELPKDRERELFKTMPGNDKGGSILDSTNPMDLMNRLRRATAMDDATSPSDAIDDALKVFELQGKESNAESNDPGII